MKKILLLANHDITIYNYRLELVKRLLEENNSVVIATPYGDKVDDLKKLGCEFREVKLSRRGTNPFNDLELLKDYIKLVKSVKPDIVFSYTIKSNVFGGIACGLLKVPYVVNITGLGTAICNGGMMQKLTLFLYKLGCKKARKVFFQNSSNQKFMVDRKVVRCENEVIPGSGVNLTKHCYEEYPKLDDKIVILTIGRIMRDKGIEEVLSAAEFIKQKYPNVIFRLVGSSEKEYCEKLRIAESKNLIEYLGERDDIHELIKQSSATLHASYHEGMANVLLESAACGRPVIATDIPGCREAFEDGVSGISFKAKNVDDMVRAIEDFLNLSFEKRKEMGKCGRAKMENEFDRNIVIEKYLQIVNQ